MSSFVFEWDRQLFCARRQNSAKCRGHKDAYGMFPHSFTLWHCSGGAVSFQTTGRLRVSLEKHAGHSEHLPPDAR
jgi:hypothetical protein